MSLAALVEGYVTGQELQQKKAREIADKQMVAFDQKFKVQQAERDYQNTKVQQGIDEKLADAQLALRNSQEKAIEEKERHNKAIEEARRLALATKVQLDEVAGDRKKWLAIYGEYNKKANLLTTQGKSPADAAEIAAALSEIIPRMDGTGTVGGGAQADPNSSQLPSLGDLSQPQGSLLQKQQGGGMFSIPGVLPQGAYEQTPKAQEQATITAARVQKMKADADLAASRKDINLLIKDATRDMQAAKVQLYHAQADKAKASAKRDEEEAKRISTLTPLQAKEYVTRRQKEIAEIAKIYTDADKDAAYTGYIEAKTAAEGAVSGGSKLSAAQEKEVLRASSEFTRRVQASSKVIDDINYSMAANTKIINDRTASPSDRASAAGLLRADRSRLEEALQVHTQNRALLDASEKAIKQLGLRENLLPSGAPDNKAQKADIRSIRTGNGATVRLPNVERGQTFQRVELSPEAKKLIEADRALKAKGAKGHGAKRGTGKVQHKTINGKSITIERLD